MDPERQPLLYPVIKDVRNRRYRALSHEEVQLARQDVHWHRGRCLLIFFFWGIMAMCLSMIACLLVTAPNCKRVDLDTRAVPSVPPVHLTLAPLISQATNKYAHELYAA